MDARCFKTGDRVKLVSMNDAYREAPIGALGTVLSSCPAPINVVNVVWDDGFSLNPCLDVDVIVKVGVLGKKAADNTEYIEALYERAIDTLGNIWAADDAGYSATEDRKLLSALYDKLEQLTGKSRRAIINMVASTTAASY